MVDGWIFTKVMKGCSIARVRGSTSRALTFKGTEKKKKRKEKKRKRKRFKLETGSMTAKVGPGEGWSPRS